MIPDQRPLGNKAMRRPSPGLGPTSGEKPPQGHGCGSHYRGGGLLRDEVVPVSGRRTVEGGHENLPCHIPHNVTALARIGVPIASTRQLHSKGPPTRESSTFLINALALKYYYENDNHSGIGNVAPARSIEVHYKKRGHEFTQWIARRLDPTRVNRP